MFGLIGRGRDEVRRTYAIGDVHGRLDLFRQLIGTIREDHTARLRVRTRIVILGDLIDHGPDSASLVRWCKGLTECSDRFVVLKGDHERMMVDAIQVGTAGAMDNWIDHGGGATLISWGVRASVVRGGRHAELLTAAREAIDPDTLRWMDALPLTLRQGGHLFVHAGIRPGVPLKKQLEHDLLGIRNDFLRSEADHGVVVVHGHSVHAAGLDRRRNRIGIDTGAFKTGRLTALGVEDGMTWPLTARIYKADALSRAAPSADAQASDGSAA